MWVEAAGLSLGIDLPTWKIGILYCFLIYSNVISLTSKAHGIVGAKHFIIIIDILVKNSFHYNNMFPINHNLQKLSHLKWSFPSLFSVPIWTIWEFLYQVFSSCRQDKQEQTFNVQIDHVYGIRCHPVLPSVLFQTNMANYFLPRIMEVISKMTMLWGFENLSKCQFLKVACGCMEPAASLAWGEWG